MTSVPQPAAAVNPPPAAMSRVVISGIDTHKELDVAAVIDIGENVLTSRSLSIRGGTRGEHRTGRP